MRRARIAQGIPEIASAVTADEMEGKAMKMPMTWCRQQGRGFPPELMGSPHRTDMGIDAYSYWWKSITKEQRVLLSNEQWRAQANRASEAQTRGPHRRNRSIHPKNRLALQAELDAQ